MFFGQMFVASALGEPDHPSWPEWDSHEIAEGLGRWVWAGVFGLALGGFPVDALLGLSAATSTGSTVIVFADLVVLGAGYAWSPWPPSCCTTASSLANPVTVLWAICQVGWDFVMPCVTGGAGSDLRPGRCWAVFFLDPDRAGWRSWPSGGSGSLALYLAMVVLRMVGLTYHAHSQQLVWFKRRPKWGIPRSGKIYPNS